MRRDKGRLSGWEGALCLSSLGIEQATRTSTRPPHPLHAAPCPYAFVIGSPVEKVFLLAAEAQFLWVRSLPRYPLAGAGRPFRAGYLSDAAHRWVHFLST